MTIGAHLSWEKSLETQVSSVRMSSPIFGIESIVTLESPKVESIAYSSNLVFWKDNRAVGSNPNDIRIFAAVKGGRLYEYIVRAESRNDKHKVRPLHPHYLELICRIEPIQLLIRYLL